jgi:histidine triad (HIT) family protein
MTECIFCKISKGEVPADEVYQDPDVMVFTDAHPIAPVHLLLIPRQHVSDINGLTSKDEPLYGKIVRIASELASKRGIASGWQLFVRVGKGGGQEVPHVHFHLVSGQHC